MRLTAASTRHLPPARTHFAGSGFWSVAAAGWTALYVASKVHHALEGRLGVTGGPVVPAGRYAQYGPGDVATAQWALAALGVAGMFVVLAPLVPLARRVNRWVLVLPLASFALIAAAGAVGMLGRALVTESGGALFGGYCVVWALLITATAMACHRGRARGPLAAQKNPSW